MEFASMGKKNTKNEWSDALVRVVYRLAHSPSDLKVAYSIRVQGNQPLLMVKAVHRTTSHFTTWNGPLNRKTFGEVKTLCPMIALRGQMLGPVLRWY